MDSFASKSKVFAFVLALLSLMALGSGLAFGQAISGNLVGTVVDSSSAVVTNASVEATNLGTGLTTTTNTGSTGGYRFDNLPVGTYKITVKASGFRTVSEQVEVQLNQTGTVNVTLSPGAATETVEVSGEAPAVDTSTAQLGSTYTSQYSSSLGLTGTGGQGGGVLNLSLLNPGVTNANAMGDGIGPSVGGMRPRDNNFTVEGVDNNNKSVTGSLASVPQRRSGELYPAAEPVQLRVRTLLRRAVQHHRQERHQRFSRSLYEYFRNRNLNAVDATFVQQGLTSNPRLDSNRYGATFGGPIIKNKLFFFTDFERQPLGLQVAAPALWTRRPRRAWLPSRPIPTSAQPTLESSSNLYPWPATGSGCVAYTAAPANGSCAAGTVEVGGVTIVPPAFIDYENFVQSVDFNISCQRPIARPVRLQ